MGRGRPLRGEHEKECPPRHVSRNESGGTLRAHDVGRVLAAGDRWSLARVVPECRVEPLDVVFPLSARRYF